MIETLRVAKVPRATLYESVPEA